MEFLVVGLNHRTAPLELRERLSVTAAQLPGALMAMAEQGLPGVILSTCNRSEFYTLESAQAAGPPQPCGPGEEGIKQFLVNQFEVSLVDLERYSYAHRSYECARHIFRVASGLDSMILGEAQILGQVREALRAAVGANSLPGPLSHLFERALKVGRKVRRETGFGQNALSVSRACVELARAELGDLSELRVMVVGVGDAGRLVAEALRESGAPEIVVTNRTYERAVDLAAELSGRAVPFEALPRALQEADLVISCTGSPGYILGAAQVKKAMAARPERPLFLMDIAIPRDIDPAVREVPSVFLHDVDDLQAVSAASRLEQEAEAQRAEELVSREAMRFLEWCHGLEVRPTVAALRQRAEEVRRQELDKTLGRLEGRLSPEELAALEAMTRAIVNKLLHGPTMYLKQSRNPDSLRLVRDLFRLEDLEPE